MSLLSHGFFFSLFKKNCLKKRVFESITSILLWRKYGGNIVMVIGKLVYNRRCTPNQCWRKVRCRGNQRRRGKKVSAGKSILAFYFDIYTIMKGFGLEKRKRYSGMSCSSG